MITTMKKEVLLEKLRANRDEHRAIFEEAVEGYRKKAVELLEEHIKRIQDGAVEKVNVYLPHPTDHTRDYDRTIALIEATVDEHVELEEHEFAQYVLDDWAWQREFLASNANYSMLAQIKSGTL